MDRERVREIQRRISALVDVRSEFGLTTEDTLTDGADAVTYGEVLELTKELRDARKRSAEAIGHLRAVVRDSESTIGDYRSHKRAKKFLNRLDS